jgi:hypothetical protein
VSASHDASRHEVPTEVNYTHGPNFSSWYHGPTFPEWAAYAERMGYAITRYVLATRFPKSVSGTPAQALLTDGQRESLEFAVQSPRVKDLEAALHTLTMHDFGGLRFNARDLARWLLAQDARLRGAK